MATIHAVDDRSGSATVASETGRLLDLMTRDLRLALSFSERTPTAVTFTVPDRDGDGDTETIRYAWETPDGDPATNGVAPLTMKYNEADAIVIRRSR